jgi:hypothetical protein
MHKFFGAVGAAALLGLSGCVGTMMYDSKFDTWHGAPLDELVMAWGIPSGEYRMQDGSRMIEYYGSRVMSVPGGTVPETSYGSFSTPQGMVTGTMTTYRQAPSTSIGGSCRTNFKVDPQGIIREHNWTGFDCGAITGPNAVPGRSKPKAAG